MTTIFFTFCKGFDVSVLHGSKTSRYNFHFHISKIFWNQFLVVLGIIYCRCWPIRISLVSSFLYKPIWRDVKMRVLLNISKIMSNLCVRTPVMYFNTRQIKLEVGSRPMIWSTQQNISRWWYRLCPLTYMIAHCSQTRIDRNHTAIADLNNQPSNTQGGLLKQKATAQTWMSV